MISKKRVELMPGHDHTDICWDLNTAQSTISIELQIPRLLHSREIHG